MHSRQAVLDYIDQRKTTPGPFVPLVDSLYAASFAGKPWVSQATLDDVFAAAEAGEYAPACLQGSTPDLTANPALETDTECVEQDETGRRYVQTIRTGKGQLQRVLVERPREGITVIDDWIADAGQLDAADWISEQILQGRSDGRIRESYGPWARQIARRGGISQIQLELPYFLYSLPGFADKPLMMLLTERERYDRSMERAEGALCRIASLLIEVGVDFIWIGAPGTELLSPEIWEDVIIPQSSRMVRHVRQQGGRSHFHCCGQSQLWVDKGYYDPIGMDVVETLSPPPAGTVTDLAAARRAIDSQIVTRGNIDLELLRTAGPEQCSQAARDVLDAVSGFPHLVGAADAILYGTPIENLRSVSQACGAVAGG